MDIFLDTKKKSIIVSLFIFFLTLIAGYNFVYKPNLKKAGQLEEMSKECRLVNEMIKEINSLQQALNVYLDKRNNTPDPSEFLSKIAEIANSCGIKIDVVSPGKPEEGGTVVFLSCKINFITPYNKLRLFMKKLESDKKFIRIDALLIESIKSIQKNVIKVEGGLWETQSQEAATQKLKKTKMEGVWVKVNMEVTGFYTE